MEVIDIEPDDLIRRMKEGKIYGESQADGRSPIFSGGKSWWLYERSP